MKLLIQRIGVFCKVTKYQEFDIPFLIMEEHFPLKIEVERWQHSGLAAGLFASDG